MVHEDKYLKGRVISPCNRCILFNAENDCGESLKECRGNLEVIMGIGWFEDHPFGLEED